MAAISDRPITPSQVRAIHVALHRRGIDDDAYRDILRQRFDAQTCKALTRAQASELLLALGRALPRPPGARKPRQRRPAAKSAPNVLRMASPAQRRLVAALACEIDWREPDGFRRWLRKSLGIERVSTAAQAAQAIEGLKAIRGRQ